MSWAHRRRGLNLWQRCAIFVGAMALIVMAVGMWQEAAPGSQPAPPTTTVDPSETFREPPRMTLGTRPPVRVP